MRINPEDIRRHYASLTDDALLALDRSELVEMAQQLYDQELDRRGLAEAMEPQVDSSAEAGDPLHRYEADVPALDDDTDAVPDWLDEAACACAFAVSPAHPHVPDAMQARAALLAARIPCHIVINQIEPASPDAPPQYECCVMVPGALNLHATSVLDREIFNPRYEADWRAHLGALSDADLCALTPEIFCAGLLDRAARLKRAYNDEITRRELNSGRR